MPLILPTPDRKEHFRKINHLLLDYQESKEIEPLAKACALILSDRDFTSHLQKLGELRPLKSTDELMALAYKYFYYFLNQRDYVAAALMLWGPETFTPEPESVQTIWNSMFNKRMISIIGGSAQGKTFSPSAWLILDWVLDPEWTRVQISSNSEDHLLRNLFGDMVRLHTEAALKLPGSIDAGSISMDKKRGMGIFILVIPGGPQSRGKIKGAHTKARPPHPLFGRRSRTRMLVDEAQEVAANIFGEIPNRFSTVTPNDNEHIKFIVCANPKDMFSPFGLINKPKDGWDRIPTTQVEWVSEEGWTVISLNGMNHENVRQRKVVFPGFITWEGVQGWLQRCHGDDQHPDMYTYVYGRFPPVGTLTAVIQQRHIIASEGEWIFDSVTTPYASCDPAFQGDLPTYAYGRSGRAIGWVRPNGEKINLEQPKVAVQIDGVAILPRGDTQDLADEIMSRLKQQMIAPECFAIDRTGVGLGTHDVIRRQWGNKVGTFGVGEGAAAINGVNYAQSPTETLIADEDTQPPSELYDRIATELWYAASKLLEYDVVRLGRGVDGRTFEELASRKGGSRAGLGKKQTIETKDAYKARTGSASPDRADAVLLLIHAMRLGTPNLIPRAKDTKGETPPQDMGWGAKPMEDLTAYDIQGMPGAPEMQMKD